MLTYFKSSLAAS